MQLYVRYIEVEINFSASRKADILSDYTTAFSYESKKYTQEPEGN
jgi:hypothetical protein